MTLFNKMQHLSEQQPNLAASKVTLNINIMDTFCDQRHWKHLTLKSVTTKGWQNDHWLTWRQWQITAEDHPCCWQWLYKERRLTPRTSHVAPNLKSTYVRASGSSHHVWHAWHAWHAHAVHVVIPVRSFPCKHTQTDWQTRCYDDDRTQSDSFTE